MRNAARIPEVLALIQQAWRTTPDLRLGQLIYTLAASAPGPDVFNIEDEELMKRLRVFAEEHGESS